jgi:hypothetical protein
VVVADAGGVLVDLHSFDGTSTVAGDDGIDRFGPDGLAYEVDAVTSQNPGTSTPTGICWVMQWGPPPPKASVVPGTGTISRLG